MQKRTIINRMYKAVAETKATSKRYHDTDWSGVSSLVADITKAMPETSELELVSAEYEGIMGECGHRKVYRYMLTDAENNITVDVQIIASFCGTMADPMGAYDLTMLLN